MNFRSVQTVGRLILYAALLLPLLPGRTLLGQEKQPLNLIILPIDNPRAMYKSFLPLKRFLEKELQHPVQLTIAQNQDDFMQRCHKNQLDIGFLCPMLYTKVHYYFGMQPVAKIQENGVATNTSAIVVREDSPIQALSDLKGKTFVYGQYHCATSGLLPRYLLLNAGVNEDDLLDIGHLGHDESAIYSVMARLYDAAGVRKAVAQKYLDKGLRIVEESFPIPQNLFIIRKDLPQDLQERIRRAFMRLNEPEYLHILKALGENVDGLVPATDQEYDIIRFLLKTLNNEDYFTSDAE